MKANKKVSSNRNKKSELPFRLHLIFIIVVILLVTLIGRLAYLQIFNGSKYVADVDRTDTTIETNNVQRGMIYDSTGKVLVGNKSHQAIEYTKGVNVLSSTLRKTADRLSKYLTVSTGTLSTQDEADYYLADSNNLTRVEKSIKNHGEYSAKALYNLAVAKVKKTVNLSKSQQNAAQLFALMNGAYELSTVYLKESDVSTKEVAEIGEHLSELPGVKVGTSWSRDYPQGNSIKSIAGTVSSAKSGLPSDKVNILLAQGYSRNDSVGQSYLEEAYDSILKGTKSQTRVEVSGNKTIKKEVKQYAGRKGDNLVLSINAAFQQKVQQYTRSAVTSAGGESTGGYAVVMNPNTGAVIALAGVDRNTSTGKVTDNALGTINEPIVMGSVVKGAMVTGALMDGVITPTNSTLTDKPIKLAGTSAKASWFNKSGSEDISLDASTALEVSSNSYMMQLAMKEGGFKYSSGAALTMSTSVFSKMRGYFEQFGLGTDTGIDIPGESSGYTGPSTQADIGKALDLAFGQYDAYTTIQVAQYISTIANGGYRIAPHVVSEIRGTNSKGGLGKVEDTIQPKILNYIDDTAAEKKVVTKGLYDVVHGTNTYKTGGSLASISPEISAKTGTAETTTNGKSTVTLSLASYAPSKNPQVVVAVAMPGLAADAESNNIQLAKKIYAAYWKMVQSKTTVEK
ncbi:penicillin-binding transpeptidase domain-containing protein [Pediococcus siamensis]|uniref:penicillin-binding transpeptidase domain-containing protein n=1 Tax=Pediococcus siamensis TaxID=381829 RepID=UPI0039A27D5F